MSAPLTTTLRLAGCELEIEYEVEGEDPDVGIFGVAGMAGAVCLAGSTVDIGSPGDLSFAAVATAAGITPEELARQIDDAAQTAAESCDDGRDW